jgi:hypothetical protein
MHLMLEFERTECVPTDETVQILLECVSMQEQGSSNKVKELIHWTQVEEKKEILFMSTRWKKSPNVGRYIKGLKNSSVVSSCKLYLSPTYPTPCPIHKHRVSIGTCTMVPSLAPNSKRINDECSWDFTNLVPQYLDPLTIVHNSYWVLGLVLV